MSKVFLKEFPLASIAAGEQYLVLKDGKKLSESSYKQFSPFLAVDVLNASDVDIKVFFNEAPESAIRLPPNASRSIGGYPIWDISVQNLGATETGDNNVIVTILNDFEQVSRYAAYQKGIAVSRQ